MGHGAAKVTAEELLERYAKGERDFRGFDLALVRARLSGTNLAGVDLTGANVIAADLSSADLREVKLGGAQLMGADLRKAKLVDAYLADADLRGAKLQSAQLTGADMRGAKLDSADLRGADLRQVKLGAADLRNADLTGAHLGGADLRDARLGGANLTGAELWGATLERADIMGAQLNETTLTNADLTNACLANADLTAANLSCARLIGANLRSAQLDSVVLKEAVSHATNWVDLDLSSAVGVPTIDHRGPSSVGIDTILRSKGAIPDGFLRGCGVPEHIVELQQAMVNGMAPIQFYSCFISYSHKDHDFAKRLHGRLQQERLRVWFAPEEMKAGRKLHEQIDDAIRVHDKLLLVLSDASMTSEWVTTEISKARRREKKEGKQVLFPIRLVDFEALGGWECFDADTGKDSAREIREYFIPDFSNWKDHDAFESAFARLIKDLRASAGSAQPKA